MEAGQEEGRGRRKERDKRNPCKKKKKEILAIAIVQFGWSRTFLNKNGSMTHSSKHHCRKKEEEEKKESPL